jgi:hypothetical protein
MADLCLLNFLGVPERVDISYPNTLETLGSMTDAWNFFRNGFGLRENLVRLRGSGDD